MSAILALEALKRYKQTVPFQKEPIKLPKEPAAAPMPDPTPQEPVTPLPVVAAAQPDVIPTQHEQAPPPEIIETLPPPTEFENESVAVSDPATHNTQEAAPAEEQIYSNIHFEQAKNGDASEVELAEGEQANYATALVGNEGTDLAEYIEDTGLKATALYDYEATADDEISFDPNDIITHIEQIDEGWWRGLCKNRYGLFPANYVQLQ